MFNKVLECVPNFSEGRDHAKIEKIVDCIRIVEGVKLLDYSSDKDHNRTVVTVVGEPQPLAQAVIHAAGVAQQLIDLTKHEGQHPRMGATDVVPFIPIQNVTEEEAIALSKEVGKALYEQYQIPVFLYEKSASAPHRENLAAVRKGQFEGMAEKMQDPQWYPDFGENHPHPTAGVTAVGMRMPLVAFNVNIDCPDFSVADRIAKKVRFIGGGFRFCKAMGVDLAERKQVQVSMNMTDFTRTALYYSYEFIKMEAKRYGVEVIGSEVIGLVPYQALYACAEYSLMCQGKTAEEVQLMDEHDVVSAAEEYLKIENFSQSQVLEFKIKESN